MEWYCWLGIIILCAPALVIVVPFFSISLGVITAPVAIFVMAIKEAKKGWGFHPFEYLGEWLDKWTWWV